VLTLPATRTDDVLAGVTVPVSGTVTPAAGQLSHLEAIREELVSRRLPAGAHDIPPAGAVV
jgi:phospholipase C